MICSPSNKKYVMITTISLETATRNLRSQKIKEILVISGIKPKIGRVCRRENHPLLNIKGMFHQKMLFHPPLKSSPLILGRD